MRGKRFNLYCKNVAGFAANSRPGGGHKLEPGDRGIVVYPKDCAGEGTTRPGFRISAPDASQPSSTRVNWLNHELITVGQF